MRQNNENPATFVTHLGAGPATPEVIARALAIAPILVAVDGGVAHAVATGQVPARIIGDLDSQPAALPDAFAQVPVTRIAEQDSTDFDKALRSTDCDLSVGVGFLGGRVDHELACLHRLAVHASRRVVLLSETDAVTLMPPEGRMCLPPGTRLSLFPLAPVEVTSAGVRWPLAREVLDPLWRVGTSNETTAREVTFAVSAPCCLIIVPASEVQALVEMRLSAPPWSRDMG